MALLRFVFAGLWGGGDDWKTGRDVALSGNGTQRTCAAAAITGIEYRERGYAEL